MSTFFLTCAITGGLVLVVQLLLGIFGMDHDLDSGLDSGHAAGMGDASEGLNLLSIRAISAGLAFFGLGGLAGMATPFGWFAGIPLALLAGFGASVGVAALMRTFRKFERDSSMAIEAVLGASAVVYLTIPGERQGLGKIHATVGGRTWELQAVTDGPTLENGQSVLVINVVNFDTVSVIRDPVAEVTFSTVSTSARLSSAPADTDSSADASNADLSDMDSSMDSSNTDATESASLSHPTNEQHER